MNEKMHNFCLAFLNKGGWIFYVAHLYVDLTASLAADIIVSRLL